jgi:hypothetical protein
MSLVEFSKLVVMLYTSGDDYTIEFNLCDDDGGGTFTITNIHDFGEFMNDNISTHRAKANEYVVQILEIKIKH